MDRNCINGYKMYKNRNERILSDLFLDRVEEQLNIIISEDFRHHVSSWSELLRMKLRRLCYYSTTLKIILEQTAHHSPSTLSAPKWRLRPPL